MMPREHWLLALHRQARAIQDRTDRQLAPQRRLQAQVERITEPLRTFQAWLEHDCAGTLGMTVAEWREITGATPAAAAAPAPAPTPAPMTIQLPPADPEPGPEAPVGDHDTWMLRRLAREHRAMPAELGDRPKRRAEWLTALVNRAAARQPGSNPKVHRNRLRPKLQNLIDSQRTH